MKEIRNAAQQLEVRQNTTSTGLTAVGYVSVWDSPSQDLGGFVEVCRKGCYAKSLRDKNQFVYFDHNSANVLGSVAAGTATFEEDSHGLIMTCDLPNTTLGNDVATLLERGDLNKMSVGFGVSDKGQRWSQSNGCITREILDATCYEGSIVTSPAFLDTSVALRSLAHFQATGTPLSASAQNLARIGLILRKIRY